MPRGRTALQKPHSPAGTLGRLAAVCALAALALPARALAHVTVEPAYVEAGIETTVTFETPNERAGHATVALVVEAPPGVALSGADPPRGWKLDVRTGRRAAWSGGRIEAARTVAFPIRVLARTRAGNQTFTAAQRYEDGEEVRWQATLSVLPAAGDEAPSQHLGRAVVAAVAGLLVLAASFLVLRRLRGRELQER